MLLRTIKALAILFYQWSNFELMIATRGLKFEEHNINMRMISDIQEHYQVPSVFMIYANHENIETSTMMQRLSREFSHKLVPSLTMNYAAVKYHHSFYYSRIVRPLFVVFLNSTEDVSMFQKLTFEYDMSYSLWLVIFTSEAVDTCIEPRGIDFKLTWDTEMMVKCYGDPVVREWYAFSENNIIVQDLAVWDREKGYRLKSPRNMYDRRHDLAGQNLRIATVKESPFINIQEGILSGFFGKILNELQNTLNFTFSISYAEDPYGSYDEQTGKWTGVIGRLTRDEADLGVAEFSMTGQRLDAVDFTHPLMLTPSYVYMKQPNGSVLQIFSCFRVYSGNVWIAINAMWLLSMVIITLLRFATEEKSITADHITENCLEVWGLYWQRVSLDFPSATPIRIAYFSVLVSAVVLMAAYSACLISYLTVSTPSLPFSTMPEFADDGSYKFITLQQSSDLDLFTNSTDTVLQKMKNQMPNQEYLPRTQLDGFKQACKDNVAFYTTEAARTQMSTGIPCDYAFLTSGRIDSLGIILKKRSQFTGVIKFHLQKFKGAGIIQRLRLDDYIKLSPPENKFVPMDLGGIVSIFIFLGVGIILSLIILIFEILATFTRTSA